MNAHSLSAASLTLLRCPHHQSKIVYQTGERVVCERGDHEIRVHGGVVDFAQATSVHEFTARTARFYDLLLPWFVLPRFFGVKPRPVIELNQRAAALARGGTLVDAACGSGLFAVRPAARHDVRHYCGLDLSLPMLERARSRCTAHDLAGALLTRADLAAMPFAEGVADVVLCCLGLQFVAQRQAVLAEIRRVVRAKGRFLGAAPALGLEPRYDRRHARRRHKDAPLDMTLFPQELERAGFALEQPLYTHGALIFWHARAV